MPQMQAAFEIQNGSALSRRGYLLSENRHQYSRLFGVSHDLLEFSFIVGHLAKIQMTS